MNRRGLYGMAGDDELEARVAEATPQILDSILPAGVRMAPDTPTIAAPAREADMLPPGGDEVGIEVAVIGAACLLPRSEDLTEFWEHLAGGHDLVSVVPEDRADLRSDPMTCRIRGGFLEHVDRFDAAFFRISPCEAALMDPQQRLFLEVAWRAFEDAGYRPSARAGSATGVFAGVGTSDYGDLLRKNGVQIEAHSATGIAHSILANRVSYLLDLRGPSEVLDTACSSALVAVHRAVAALVAGECDMCIAGGVNVMLSPMLFTTFSKAGMLAADGKCKAFDQAADGYVRGEGAGAVLLKPLEAALCDGDHVYAVIKSSAVNHGGHTMSLTAPSTAAQTRLLVSAYRKARIAPDTVTYLEAHGTGTRSGDRVEMSALWRAFAQLYAEAGRPLPKTKRIGVGSVKTNVGHLEAAAGIAGLLKVLLAMKHGELPASLHFHEVSPSLKLDEGPFFVQHQKMPWQGVLDPSLGRVLRAGVSAFGSGGSNAHVVLEWRDLGATRAAVHGPGERLLVLSAPDPAALQAYASRLARALEADERIQLPSVAYTLQVGREELAERLAIVVGDRAAAVAALAAFARGELALPPIYRGTAVRRTNGAGERPAASGALAALAQRWVGGGAIDWNAFWPDGTPERASLPSFPFTKVRHWFDAPAAAEATEPPRAPVEPTRAGAALPGVAKPPG